MMASKTSVLVLSAIFICLSLLPASDPRRPEAAAGETAPTGFDAAQAQQQPFEYSVEAVPAAVPDSVDPEPPAPAAGDASATPLAPTRSIDWREMLYPELARISELEQESAAAALAELVPMLANDDPAVRLAAIESVGDMTIATVLPVLSMALDDPDPRVRMTALQALATREDASVSANVESRLYDQQAEVRLAAIDALAALEAKTAVSALAGLLSDPEVSIRRHAVNALGDIGGENAMRYLLQARYDPNEGVRSDADAILAEATTEPVARSKTPRRGDRL